MTGDQLPPGQRAADWERFGLPQYARRVRLPEHPTITVGGRVAKPVELDVGALLAVAPRVDARSDLNCVTTWTAQDLEWSGVRFADVLPELAALVEPDEGVRWIRLTGHDTYAASLSLDDARAADVLLADRLDGRPLRRDEGAPVRLVAPAHYGYKGVKHLARIDFTVGYDAGSAGWRGHPRGRVALEERSQGLPGAVWRYIWRAALPLARRPYRSRQASGPPGA